MISHLKKKTAYPAAIFVDDSDKKTFYWTMSIIF